MPDAGQERTIASYRMDFVGTGCQGKRGDELSLRPNDVFIGRFTLDCVDDVVTFIIVIVAF